MVRKKISEIIEVPQEVKIKLSGNLLKISKDGEELERKLSYPIEIQDNKIIIGCEKPTKKDKKLIKTTAAHIKNLIFGLREKYVYKLQICSVHFPISVSVSDNEVIIKNFLGEVKERKAEILPEAEVKIENDIITVESSDKEKAGQTAANIEQATKVRNKDRRIFQDGIFIIEKAKGRKK
jgi:large subunit ribosomal protein L6